MQKYLKALLAFGKIIQVIKQQTDINMSNQHRWVPTKFDKTKFCFYILDSDGAKQEVHTVLPAHTTTFISSSQVLHLNKSKHIYS